MTRLLLTLALLMPLPATAQSIYVYPATVTAPRGSYQTCTAVVDGLNAKQVNWTASGGTLVGINPSTANEPATIALYATTPGTYALTAHSVANGSLTGTCTITITASPTPVTTHPRLMVTAAMLPGLQAKATAGNTLYQALKGPGAGKSAVDYYNNLSAAPYSWSWSCKGGTGLPASGASASWLEGQAYLFAFMSMVDPSDPTYNWGCYGRDVWTWWMNQVTSGALNINGNEWSDSSHALAFTTDWLMAGGYLSAADQIQARAFLAHMGDFIVNQGYGSNASVGNYNSPSQFNTGSVWDLGSMRSMGNNYTESKYLILTGVALTFNDTAGDDPALANTCGATRYQVCPDGTAGSLHAYFTYLTGGMFYKDYGHLEDPNVSWQAYQAAYGNLPTQPMCELTDLAMHPCFGDGRGGEGAEGSWYIYSLYRLRYAFNAIHTAGYDDPILYGPQMSLGTSSWWDMKYISDLEFITGFSSGNGGVYGYISTGDTQEYQYGHWMNDMWTEAAMLTADTYTGRTDRTNALEWLELNSAIGGPLGTAGGCTSHCGFTNNLANDYGNSVVPDLFIALPAGDPTASLPADPRPSLPLDLYNGSNNQHIMVRNNWTSNDTFFSYYSPNTMNDHEHQFSGRFDVFSNNEYITKGRMEFTDYNDIMTTAPQQNLVAILNTTGTDCTQTPYCSFWPAFTMGGQMWHEYQAGLTPALQHAELPSYVAAINDTTNEYNGSANQFGDYNDVRAASRSLVYLRGTNQVVYYDRAVTGHAASKALYMVTTGPITLAGSVASWPTRSATQRAYLTSLLPSGAAVSDAGLTAGNAPQASDWEPYSTVEVNSGTPLSTQFLSVLEWGPSSFGKSTTTLVQSNAGQTFDGAAVGSSLVMFMRSWPGTLSSTTFPASGATTVYVSDLSPNTTYAITAAGAPGTATTDTAGVLTFSATGSGNVTVIGKSGSDVLPKMNQSLEIRVGKGAFWLSLIGVIYTYVGYPLVMWALARFRPRPWNVAPIVPSVSFVLAVHNGVSLLPGKIQHLLGLDYPNIREIIIVSDGSTDGTAELLASQQDTRLQTVVLSEHRGKAVAVNAGVAEATAEVIVFVDIRPEIAPGAIQQLVSNFADEKVGCVSGNLKLREEGHDPASAAVGGFYWRYEQWLRTCEAISDSPVGVYGGFYAIRRMLYVQQPAGIILDDMFQPLSIIHQGYRSVVDPRAFVYDTWPKESAAEFHRKVRTLAGNFQLFQLMPWTLTPRNRLMFQLVSHKGMRLVVPYLLLLLLVSAMVLSAGSPVFAALAALQIVCWAVALLGLRYTIPGLRRVAAPASALLVLNAAAVVGFYKFLFTRGPLWKIWNTGKLPPRGIASDGESVTIR